MLADSLEYFCSLCSGTVETVLRQKLFRDKDVHYLLRVCYGFDDKSQSPDDDPCNIARSSKLWIGPTTREVGNSGRIEDGKGKRNSPDLRYQGQSLAESSQGRGTHPKHLPCQSWEDSWAPEQVEPDYALTDPKSCQNSEITSVM